MAAGQVDYDTVIKVLKTDSLKEAQMILEESVERSRRMQQETQQQQMQMQQQLEAQKHQWKLEEIKLQGELDIQREKIKVDGALKKQAMLSVGFNENKDVNKNKELDVMEVYKKGEDAKIKATTPATQEEQQIKEEKGNKE